MVERAHLPDLKTGKKVLQLPAPALGVLAQAAQARIAELEERARAPQRSGGSLSGLFGVPSTAVPRETSLRGSRPSPVALSAA